MADKDEPRGRRAKSRAALLDAAVTVFVARGYEAASLDDIAAIAGYTRGAVYSSFDDKEDLFLAAVSAMNEKWITSFTEVFRDARKSGELRLESLARLWEKFAIGDEKRHRLMLEFRVFAMRNSAAAKRLAEFERRTEAAMAAIVQEDIDAGAIDPVLPADDVAALMYAASEGILLHEMSCRTRHSNMFSNLVKVVRMPSSRSRAKSD